VRVLRGNSCDGPRSISHAGNKHCFGLRVGQGKVKYFKFRDRTFTSVIRPRGSWQDSGDHHSSAFASSYHRPAYLISCEGSASACCMTRLVKEKRVVPCPVCGSADSALNCSTFNSHSIGNDVLRREACRPRGPCDLSSLRHISTH
jgi:hypothetical protein